MALPAKKKTQRRPLRWVALFILTLLLIFGANRALNWLGDLPIVTLKEVSIKGTINHVSPDALRAVAKQTATGNFFTADMKSVQASFENLKWVRSASVRRVWPDRLEVTLEEHEPLARWGTDALVNVHGEVFHADYKGDLPRFVGPAGSEREVTQAYREFREMLKAADLEPKEVLLSPRRAWQVKLASGMVLDLGRVETHQRLERFVAVTKVAPDLRERKGRADLRYPNGFALKLTGPAPSKEDLSKAKITE